MQTYRMPSFWKVQAIGWFIYWWVLFVTFLPMAPAEGQTGMLLKVKLARAIIGFILTSLLHPFYKRLANRAALGKLIPIVFLCSVMMGVVWLMLADLHKYWLTATLTILPDLRAFPRTAIDYAMTIAAWSSAYFGYKHWQQWQIEREHALRSEALLSEARLETLRYQIHPHFLFNSLNSVRALVDEDAPRAKRMVTELAEFLRYSLLMAVRAVVPLHEEIAALRSYLAVESIRFEDRLQVEFNVEPEAQHEEVPVLLLHPLVENAIKHGFAEGREPLRVCITARCKGDSLLLEVANTGNLDKQRRQENGTGTGLRNVSSRLQQAFGSRAHFEIVQDGSWIRAQVAIPLSATEASHARELARAHRG